MALCPNLVSLILPGWDLDDENKKQYPQLRVLVVCHNEGYGWHPPQEHEWVDLLCKLPGLVVLSIDGFPDVDSLDLFSQHCPTLKCLRYNVYDDDCTQWPYSWDTSIESGIQHLAIHQPSEYMDIAQELNEVLLRILPTLKHFHMKWSTPYPQRTIPLPSGTVFPHLVSLSGDVEIDHDDEEDDEDLLGLLIDMIFKAPNLETIDLGITWMDPEPMILMSSYRHLVNVDLVMEEGYEDLDALKGFLDAHLETSSLRSLSISLWTQECVDELLPRITKLTLLEELHIVFGHRSPLTPIIDGIGASHEMNIRQLKLTDQSNTDCMQEAIFSSLRDARSLKSVTIEATKVSHLTALSLIELPSKIHIQMPLDGLNISVLKVLRKRFMNLNDFD